MASAKIFKNRTARPKKILFVASESAPFAHIGGLGSVIQSLPKALCSLGHDARVFLPRYVHIDPREYNLETVREGLKVPTDNAKEPFHLVCNVQKYENKKEQNHPVIYFLENQEYYEKRANVYGYLDDHVRWALLSRGALEFFHLDNDWTPDIIVASDWMTGLVPHYLKTNYQKNSPLSGVASVFSIHNLSFQGLFDHKFVHEMDYDDGHSKIPGFHSKRLAKLNSVRRGIMYADAINTVSPSYAKEITTEKFGEGLHHLLRERKAALRGILNGIDYEKWDPANDPMVKNNFTSKTIKNRIANKAELQESFGLPKDNNAFLVSIVSRLDGQKGFDLLYPVAETLLRELPMQLIVLGEGDSGMMSFFRDLETKYPKQVSTHLKFDNILPREIFSGTDAVLIPSRFEPSGLTQMEAMRYGAIPIVRKTGGLADTVENFDPAQETGCGFVFERADSSSLLITVVRAFETFRHKKTWQALQKCAMSRDFSWEQSAKKYEKLFIQALELRAHDKTLN